MQNLLSPLFAVSICFSATVLCILLLKPLAIRIGLVDTPGGRKQHQHATPLIGGIAMFLGILTAMTLLPISLQAYRGFVVACGLMVFVGVLDDFHELSPRGRLLAQVLALCIMIFWADIRLDNLGNLFGFGDINLGLWSIPVTLFGAATLINAINMLDGLDGLAGSVTLISLTTLMIFALTAGLMDHALILAVIISALVGFLLFNVHLPGRKQAHIFMGDAGSMLLGFILAWFTIDLSQQATHAGSPAIMLWVVGIPLIDLATVFIARLKQRRSPMSAGRDHIHHWLIELGVPQQLTVTLTLSAMMILAFVGYYSRQHALPDRLVFMGFILLYLVYAGLYFSFKKKNQIHAS